jgi:hypothetical protein
MIRWGVRAWCPAGIGCGMIFSSGKGVSALPGHIASRIAPDA